MVATGASVNVAQELAPHSTSRLTVDRYAHTRLHDLQGALDAMPSHIGNAASEAQAMKAMGTDDQSQYHPTTTDANSPPVLAKVVAMACDDGAGDADHQKDG